jgi:tellurite methyltransferase
MKQGIHPWERAWRSGRWMEKRPPLQAVVDFCQYLNENGLTRVLDLGAGGGKHTVLLAEKGFQVVALDVSETALKVIDQRVRTAGIRNVTLVWHGMHHIPFPDGYFDAVVSTNVMHHGLTKEVKAVVEEVRRVVRSGGAGLFVVVSDKDFRFGTGRKLEPKTYVFTRGDEKGIVHHFFGLAEFRSFLKGFRVVNMWEELVEEVRGTRAHIYVVVRKP